MQSGCPRSPGGAYPAFQRRGYVDIFPSLQANITHVPVVCPTNGHGFNMLAAHCPVGHKLSYNPAERQGHNAQSHFQGFCHQKTSQATTGFYHPKPGDGACMTWNSHHQLSQKVSASYTSQHVAAKCSTYFDTSANESLVRQSVNYSGQQRDFPNVNVNTRLQQRPPLNCPTSAGSSSVALKGNTPGVTAQTCPSKVSDTQKRTPLLHALLTENHTDITTSYLSKKMHCKIQQVKGSRDALNCGQTRAQNLQHTGRTHPSPPQQQVTSTSLCPDGRNKPLTDEQMDEFIKKEIENFKMHQSRNEGKRGATGCNNVGSFCTNRDSKLQEDRHMPELNNVARLPTATASDVRLCFSEKHASGTNIFAVENTNCASVDFHLPVKIPLDLNEAVNSNKKHLHSDYHEDTFGNSSDKCFYSKWCDEYIDSDATTLQYSLIALKELIASLEKLETNKVAEMDISEVILQRFWNGDMDNVRLFTSTEYPQIMENVAATCTKKEDENPVVLSAVAQDYKSCWSTTNRKWDELDQDTGLRSVGYSSVTGVSQDFQTKSTSQLPSLQNQHTKYKTPISPANKAQEVQTVNSLKDPQYDDISDDEGTFQLLNQRPPNSHCKDLNFKPHFENPCYEDVSDVEKLQIGVLAVETPIFIHEPNNKESENGSHGHVQDQAQMKRSISHKELIPNKQVSSKTQTKKQTNNSDSCCAPDLSDGDQTDGQMDDDCICIPIVMSQLRFEPVDKDQDVLVDSEHTDQQSQGDSNPTHYECPAVELEPVADSPTCQLEVFDTMQSFIQTKALQFGKCLEVVPCRSTTEHEQPTEIEPETGQNKTESQSETEDGYETEDSDDYPSTPTNNFLTVSAQFLKKRSESLAQDTDDSLFEKESEDDEDDEVINVPNDQTGESNRTIKQNELNEDKVVSKHFQRNVSQNDDIIILDSDTEDEDDQDYKKAKRRRLSPSGVVEHGDTSQCQKSTFQPESMTSQHRTMTEKFQKNIPPSADFTATPHQFKPNDMKLKDVTENTCSDLPHSTETRVQLVETTAASSDGRKNNPTQESIIIHDSDTEDDDGQNEKKEDEAKVLCIQQTRHSHETLERGASEEKQKEMTSSSADSLVPTHQSNHHDAHVKDAVQVHPKSILCLYRKNSGQGTKRKKLKKVLFQDPVDHSQQKTNERNRKKVATERALASVSKDRGDASFAAQNKPSEDRRKSLCGTAVKKPQTIQSSVDKADSAHMVQCLLVKESSRRNHLELSDESKVHRGGKDETPPSDTPTATSKKTDSCKKDSGRSYRDQQGRVESKPKPANDKGSPTTSNVNVKLTNPRRFSKQLSLPAQIQERPKHSTPISSSTSKSRKISETKQSSASTKGWSPSGESTSAQHSTSARRTHSSSSALKRSHSYSGPLTLDQHSSPNIVSSYVASPAKAQLFSEWQKTSIPTKIFRRRRRNTMEMVLENTDVNESKMEARPAPGHKRHKPFRAVPSKTVPFRAVPPKSCKTVTPLMKRTRMEAQQIQMAKNRDVIREKSNSVGEGYKWVEKPSLARTKKDSYRERKRHRSP